jgi:hypothetical protein
VIIHLGTNGEFQYANLTSVMDLLRDVDRVFVVTIHGPSYTDANNAQIRALPTSYPNVQVIDWDREITENCTGDECLAADNIHPGADGAALYVSLVRGALGI